MSEDWQRLGQKGAAALAAGQFAEASSAFRELLELTPEHADSWYNLAYSLRHQRDYVAAVYAYGKALSLGATGPEEVLVNRALIYSEHLARTDLAEADLRKAVALAPAFLPAWLNLGMLHEDLGNRVEAIAAYRAALAIAPASGRALARVAALATDPEAALHGLQAAIARGSMSGEDLAEAQFAVGNLLDQCGRYDEAFAAIAQANSQMAALRPANLRYDPRAQEQLTTDLMAAYPSHVSLAGDASCDGRMVFICGMFRSGSTVAEQLLARHPAIVAAGELEYVPAFVAEYLQPYPRAALTIDHALIERMRAEYGAAIDRLAPGKRLVTDKRPDNFLHIGLIRTLFPSSRVLHTVRNPLDTLLSIFFLNFAQSVSYGERLDDIAHYLTQYRRLMTHWHGVLGDDLISIDYDRLVHDAPGETDRVYQRLNIEPQDVSAGQAEAPASPIRTPSAWQARAPLHTRSSGRWHNYERHLEPYLHLLDP